MAIRAWPEKRAEVQYAAFDSCLTEAKVLPTSLTYTAKLFVEQCLCGMLSISSLKIVFNC